MSGAGVVMVKLLKLTNSQIHRLLALDLAHLYFLEVSHSKSIKIVSQSFSRTKRLKELALVRNKIRFLTSDMFQDLKMVKVLNLNGNKIRHLTKDMFLQVKMLEKLYLRDNNIARIEDFTFMSLRQLKVLNLAKNDLEHVSSVTFRGLTQLRTLILSENNISQLPEDILENFDRLESLHLSANPLLLTPQIYADNETRIIFIKEDSTSTHKYASESESLHSLFVTGLTIVIIVMVFVILVLLLVFFNASKKDSTRVISVYFLYSEQDEEIADHLRAKLTELLPEEGVNYCRNMSVIVAELTGLSEQSFNI